MGQSSSGKGGGQTPTTLYPGPFQYGPSQFDLNAIMSALGMNQQMITNRSNQLGLGGSTMEGQDLGNIPSATMGARGMANAMIGNAQTQDVGNPAFNPALQPAMATPASTTPTTSLSSLGNLFGNLGNLAGGG